MPKTDTQGGVLFSQPIRQIVTMLLVSGLVAAGAWFIHDTVLGIIWTNPWLNGFIAGVFLLAVVTCFWQVFILVQSVSWIESFARHEPGSTEAEAPLLLAPLAQLLRSRGARSHLSASSTRSILESVATRIDEARDITRYLINLLIFLGLLGTFYGLATTVPAVVDTIRSLAPEEGETGLDVFSKLMGGLESQLGGMGTAFSSSLLGLAGSLVVGLLELFAGHGQNRFYRELEDWLASITRVGFASGDGEGENVAMAGLIDHLGAQIDVLQTIAAQGEFSRAALEERLPTLGAALERLAAHSEATLADATAQSAAQTAVLARIAEGQERLIAALGGAETAVQSDAESRMRLRSIDVQLLKILEEMAAGRAETTAELRADLTTLTAAVRQLGRGR
ncbi:MAG: biopolymer transporter ExbB [Alphaproteobacteria bacterium]|nr:biopolymer transporter ExbB [Alphaproteobacteria bacterium]